MPHAKDDWFPHHGKPVSASPETSSHSAWPGSLGDGTIRIWDVTDGRQQQIGHLKGHEGPVWKVSWAHPRFGHLLATAGYDMKVIIWKEDRGHWVMAYVDSSHAASVNDVEFAPQEHGLRLACASSDGQVSVLSYSPADGQWRRSVMQAHSGGAQTVNWAPVSYRDGVPCGSVRLATGGCDHTVKIWRFDNEVWCEENPRFPYAHTDWAPWREKGHLRRGWLMGVWSVCVNLRL
ncbi:unnamed protein product [Durusdinium trenchii]|uniref:Protein transport protein SEC13 n=1 Tax=Durusdinium trenchii TaxID=1381693 RepID=A0ABP0H8J5_9DINO